MVYLLSAILFVLTIGLGLAVTILYEIRINQGRGEAAILNYLKSVFGEPFDGDAARLMSELSSFHDDIRKGRYPYLRRDDWYPRKADLARWEEVEMRRTYCDD
jgi:hypothetical protein